MSINNQGASLRIPFLEKNESLLMQLVLSFTNFEDEIIQ